MPDLALREFGPLWGTKSMQRVRTPLEKCAFLSPPEVPRIPGRPIASRGSGRNPRLPPRLIPCPTGASLSLGPGEFGHSALDRGGSPSMMGGKERAPGRESWGSLREGRVEVVRDRLCELREEPFLDHFLSLVFDQTCGSLPLIVGRGVPPFGLIGV